MERDDCKAKFWLDPVRLERSQGFSRHELNRIEALVEANQQHFQDSWNEYFAG